MRADRFDPLTPEQLAHPCPHFISSACSIYAIRPRRCRQYQCEVLEHMMCGDLARDEAHRLVEQALAMRALVQDALPEGLTATRLAQDIRDESPDTRTPARLLALAQFVAYRLFVERHFLAPKSRWLTHSKAEQVEGEELKVSLWPNPARDVLTITLDEFMPNQKMELTLMQADGKVQTAQALTPTVKGQQVRMDVSRMAAGLYLLQVKQGLISETKRVIIVR